MRGYCCMCVMGALARVGTLPGQWSSLPLIRLNIRNNRVSGAAVAQPRTMTCCRRPEWKLLYSMSQVLLLGLRVCRCAGTLPPEWASLSNIQELVLSSNSLRGLHASMHGKMLCTQAPGGKASWCCSCVNWQL